MPLLLSADFSVFAFDFSGSGKSGGEYISLGWYERDDLAAVVAYLRACPNTSSIGVWVSSTLSAYFRGAELWTGSEYGGGNCTATRCPVNAKCQRQLGYQLTLWGDVVIRL